LYDNGKSSGIDVQEAIGMNEFFDKKGVVYFNRASANFDAIVRQLHVKELVKLLPDDCYELTKSGKNFIENYIVR
jgi:predicted transcriptional regulator